MAISIYSTPTCSYCKAAKEFFRERHIPFTEYDISRDRRKADEMFAKTSQTGVPVIDVNGKIIVGFDVASVKKALGI